MSASFGKITSNTLIQGIERVLSISLGFFTVALLTRLLGVAGFGTYSTIVVILQFAASIVDFGLALTLSQMLAEPSADRPRILGTIIPLRIATSGFAFVLAAGFAALMPSPVKVPLGVLAMAGAFLGMQLAQLLAGYFREALAIGIVAVADVGQRFLYLLILLLLTNGMNSAITLPVILWGATATQLLAAAVLVLAILRKIPLRWSIDRSMTRTILRRNLPLSLSMLATLFYFKADTIILSLYRSPTEVGLYSAPYRLLETLVNLPHLFLSLVLPLLTAAWTKGDLTTVKHLWQWSFDLTVLLTLPVLVGGWLTATPLIVLVAGPAFAASGIILKILLPATALIMLGTQSAYVVLATHRQRVMLPVYVAASTLTVAAYFWLIPQFGAIGAAWITLVVEAVMAIANTLVAYRVLGWLPPLRGILPMLGATATMTLVVILLKNQPVGIVVLLGALTYLLALPQLGFDFRTFQKI